MEIHKPTNRTATIVYGPQGCGKTRNAEAIAKAYGCATIVDTGKEGCMGLKREDITVSTLVLCVDEPDLSGMRFDFPVRVVTYKVAIEMVKIDEEGRA